MRRLFSTGSTGEWIRKNKELDAKQAQLDTFLDSPEYIEALNKAADTLAAAAKEFPQFQSASQTTSSP